MRIIEPHRVEYYKRYFRENKKLMYLQRREARKNRREKMLSFFGNKCEKCGFDNPGALQLDHIKGGGNKEIKFLRKNNKDYTFIQWKEMILEPNKFRLKYQLLCANCNWIKKTISPNEFSGKKVNNTARHKSDYFLVGDSKD